MLNDTEVSSEFYNSNPDIFHSPAGVIKRRTHNHWQLLITEETFEAANLLSLLSVLAPPLISISFGFTALQPHSTLMNCVILSLLHTYTPQFGLPMSAWFGRCSQKGFPYPFLSLTWSFVSIHLHIVDCLGLMSLCIMFRETDYKIILTRTLCWIGFASHDSCLRYKVPERKINKLYSTPCFRMSDGWTIVRALNKEKG